MGQTSSAEAFRPLVAALTGAGVSTDSGLRDYRGPQGLWRDDPANQRLVTIDSYLADPEIRARSWQLRLRTGVLQVQPNAAHRAFAAYERTGLPLRVLTQNVDGLHQLGGVSPRKVLELHGTARRTECTRCHARGDMAEALDRVRAGEADPPCTVCGGVLKSATVYFGEHLNPQVLGEARAIAAACDVLLAVGTTLQVHPAAGLVDVALAGGARVIVVNADPTPYDSVAAEVIREPIGTSVPALLRRLAKEADVEWPESPGAPE
ncbi:SIR2 family NAD-dependent protein deacylase [Streptacidiphilus fuscans]|uniref:protein acetyllysine N-acetyltransferase n=1 Tax=Streptacidiphilus fuscans TaxID=2789292 RepID=A0A931FIS1_9ACTN|nr:Sir2 family NAD-dependent protein deacetylase [Streptacidiphilus fuscans]MBF9073655.1 Sir2 family NAD-dependent protein deacetylase [Streptacidiphilus fuscans]